MKFGIIGHPVAGSMSPVLFTAAYDGRYPYDLLDFDNFADAWACFQEGYDGINVTAPYKQDAFAAVPHLSQNAQRSGAVNLVVKRPEGLFGYNTDVDGVVFALQEAGVSGADALVVGAGGAARAAVVAAQSLGLGVTVCNRTFAKAAALASALRCDVVPMEDVAALSPSLVIYTLPGSAPVPPGLPFSGAFVLEAEYKKPVLAGVPCRRYISGRRWLLGQAVTGYSLFTGEAPSQEKMLRVL